MSNTEPWLERAIEIFAPLDVSASLVTSSSSRYVTPIPPSSMTLRDRTKGKKSPVPIRHSPSTSSNDTKPNTVINDQKDEASAYGVSSEQSVVEDAGGGGSPCLSSIKDETLTTKKKLPRVILRLGKPPDLPV